MIDVAPTITTLLGANIPATSQGRALTEMLSISPEQVAQLNQAYTSQQVQLAHRYLTAIGQPDVLKADDVTANQRAMQAAKMDRLSRERLPRMAIAFMLVLIPAYVLFLKRGHVLLWLLGGALAYILLFNLRYAILDGRTYSLSSVSGVSDIISYAAITALMAFGLAWLGVMVGLKMFKESSLQAAETSLALTFVTLYLVFLPALWSFAMNGALITWRIPDFGSMFLGFLSILQALFIAAVGLILTGISALVAKLVR
jgi:hypothetical protein